MGKGRKSVLPRRALPQVNASRAGILLIALALPACTAIPSKTLLHYSPPSVMPVRRAIATAQEHAAAAQQYLRNAGTQEKTEHLAIANAANEIDALTDELLNAQSALTKTETDASAQTQLLNAANDSKNAAITAADAAKFRYHRLKFYACLIGAAAALLLALRLGVLSFVPPPYNFVAVAAVPVIAFGALWIEL